MKHGTILHFDWHDPVDRLSLGLGVTIALILLYWIF
jgi:hypothetical protein